MPFDMIILVVTKITLSTLQSSTTFIGGVTTTDALRGLGSSHSSSASDRPSFELGGSSFIVEQMPFRRSDGWPTDSLILRSRRAAASGAGSQDAIPFGRYEYGIARWD